MKGFKKDGKFRPTEKRNKSSLSKKDLLNIKIQDKIDLATDGGVGLHKISVLRDEIADLEEQRDSMRGKESLDEGWKTGDKFPKKASGLNKVEVVELGKDANGVSYDPPLFQVNVNGKGAYFPANEELAREQAERVIGDAEHHDKMNTRINQ